MTTPAAKRRSCSVYDGCALTPSSTINKRPFAHICILNLNIFPGAASGGGSERRNRISDTNFLIVFHSKSCLVP